METPRAPIIDMHLHAVWWGSGMQEPLTGLRAPESSDNLRDETFAAMDRYNIVKGVMSGPLIQEYKTAAPERIIAGFALGTAFGIGCPVGIGTEALRLQFGSGKFETLAEVVVQYEGLGPGDIRLDPYFTLAEELDFPVGIHVGPGPQGVAAMGFPEYRMSLSNPLLLEDALVKHPKLRLWISHAGWPMLDAMVGLLYCYPQVYADVAVINWMIPVEEFHCYLRRLVHAGFTNRIMFGSDQMVWPQAIGIAIERIESAPFLSATQKRNILYNNAARFLRLDN